MVKKRREESLVKEPRWRGGKPWRTKEIEQNVLEETQQNKGKNVILFKL
jgi:hypothetical protein